MGGNLADSIDNILEEHKSRLLDNIMGNEASNFLKGISITTKDMIVKDHIMRKIKKSFDVLNEEFKDVKFDYNWIQFDRYQYKDSEISNEEYTDDEHDLDKLYSLSRDQSLFYHNDLHEIYMKFYYYWQRKCSLGCQHVTKRFMIINMPKILGFTSNMEMGMPVRTLVKEFIPDFYYDPTIEKPKRGRPKRQTVAK